MKKGKVKTRHTMKSRVGSWGGQGSPVSFGYTDQEEETPLKPGLEKGTSLPGSKK